MHRISFERDVKQALLDNEGLLLTGWGFVSNDSFLNSVYGKDKRTYNDIYEKAFSSLPHNRYFLYMFINEFKKGDYVLVPGNKDFSVYEITSECPYSKKHIMEKVKNAKDCNLERDTNMNYWRISPHTELELGFFWEVRPVALNISRELYAKDVLRKRLKFFGTTGNITVLAQEIEDSIQRYKNNTPFILRNEITADVCSSVLKKLQEVAGDGSFEKVVKYYLERIGASTVVIPAKAVLSKEQGDADVVADFNELQVRIIVQVKHYLDVVDEKAVRQIISAEIEYDDGQTVIPWVIASCDNFTDEAKKLAEENGVRLIGGTEFSSSLLDVGLGGLYGVTTHNCNCSDV